jgi:ABC-2 type transport system permease protein
MTGTMNGTITRTLLVKVLRDLRVSLIVVMLLIGAFQCLWAKITQRIIKELLPEITRVMFLGDLEKILFQGPGKLMQTLMGGESIRINSTLDMLSIGYVHPLMQIIFCIWAVGRASGAIAGEIDRGTMELLLAQPIARWRVVFAHFLADVITIPLLCLALWAGNWLGTGLVGMLQLGAARGMLVQVVDPCVFGPALWNVGALIFAVSGYTMALSAAGRFRNRVLGFAVLVTLVQFLVNVVGQLWDVVEPLRPLTVFYYYQPQQIILSDRWTVGLGSPALLHVNAVLVLFAVGAVGYAIALWTFCRRDLPAPL